jgi:hypothetical protein
MRCTRKVPVLLGLFSLVLAGCGDRGLGPDTVAQAGDFRFTVDEAAELIAPEADLPADPAVIEALTDFWVDYSLLALAVNQNGTLASLDLSAITRQQRNQELVLMLRDEVIDVDTEISDEELEEIYATERPGERVRARHILLFYPENATEAQRDSVQVLAEELRDRARAGADFAALAEEYSDDQGSAARGGDLDYFARGTMVPPFEEAAFALQPGEVSDVVETQFGLHVIRLEDRDLPELDDVREQVRGQLQRDRVAAAESAFVAQVEEPAQMRLADDAHETAREMARNFAGTVESRASRTTLVHFSEGAYTGEDYQHFLAAQPGQLREQIADANDEQLGNMLRELARGELLVREAHQRGIALPEEEIQALDEEIRGEYERFAEMLELDAIERQEGESLEQAVEREIRALMPQLVRGQRDVFPMGPLAIPLRSHFGVRISRENMERAAERVRELRGGEEMGEQPPMDMEELERMLQEQMGEPSDPPGDEPDGSDPQ